VGIEKTDRIKAIKIALYCGAAFLLPNVFLFFLYNRNVGRAYIRFDHVLILGLGLSLIGICVLLIMRLITRSFCGAYIIAIVFWALFWLFETIFLVANGLIPALGRVGLLAIFIVLLFVSAAIIRIEVVKLNKICPGIQALAAMTLALFLFNFVPSLVGGVNWGNRLAEDGVFYVKRSFNIDRALPSPDIYWIHMDGMLGFSTVERLFGDSQDNLRRELYIRGFVINEYAKLNAGWTLIALPALLSPGFYDSYLGSLLRESEHYVLRADREPFTNARMAQDGVSHYSDIAPYYELFQAFMAIGYTTIQQTCAVGHGFLAYSSNRFHAYDHPDYSLGINEALHPRNRFLLGVSDLVDLMTFTTPLSIFQDYLRISLSGDIEWFHVPEHEEMVDKLTANTRGTLHERQILRHLIDSFSVESPKLVYAVPSFTHSVYWRTRVQPPGYTEPFVLYNPFTDNVYMNAHEYAAMVMLTMIDLILENNPHAVIVLQSDHGIHDPDIQGYLRAGGMSNDDLFEIINSTMSAVRIPQIYGGLDAPIAPINITRELVNRFIGHNYEMAVAHDPLGGD